jgi:octaprenyl-diphosphate synthase
MGSFGHLIGIAYQIHDDIMDWNNEDRLFNILVRNNEQSVEFIDKMEQLYISYSSKAKNELKKINDSVSKKHLEHLTDLTFLQF